MFVLDIFYGVWLGAIKTTPREDILSGEDNKEKKERRKRRKDLLTISYKE